MPENVVLNVDPIVMIAPVCDKHLKHAQKWGSNGRVVSLDGAECFVEETYDISSGKRVAHIMFSIGFEVVPGEVKIENFAISLAMNGKKCNA